MKKPTTFGIMLFAAILSISLASALNIEDINFIVDPGLCGGGNFYNSQSNIHSGQDFIANHTGNIIKIETKIECNSGLTGNRTFCWDVRDNKWSLGGNIIGFSCSQITCGESWQTIYLSNTNITKGNKYYLYMNTASDEWLWKTACPDYYPNSNAWYYDSNFGIDNYPGAFVLQTKITTNTSDTDNDLVADEDDSCPLVQGLTNNFGCPDTELPVISLISPSNNSYQSSFNPNYTVSDISSYSCYSVNSTISEGINYWKINCTDIYNNNGISEQRMFKMDTVVPIINLISPENNSYQASFIPNYSVTEANPYSCFSVNDSVEEGYNYFKINCTDEAGNIGLSEEQMFKIDTTKPTTTRNGTNLICSDNILCQKIFWNLGTWNEGTEFNLSEGINNLSYYSIDENNNTEETVNEMIEIDTTKPIMSVNSPLNQSYENNVTVNISVSDINLNALSAEINGSVYNSTLFSIELPLGNHSIRVYANDTFGNSEEKTVNFTVVDITPPSIILSYSGSILYAATNENSICYYNTSDANLTLMNETYSKSSKAVLNLPYGSYNYYTECLDISGNKANLSISISLTQPPISTPLSNSGGGVSHSDSAPIGYFGTPASNKESIVISAMNPGEQKDIKINNKELAIRQISIEVNNQARNIDITITKESGKPAEVTKAASENEKEYEYLTINHPNLKNEDIKKGVISFEVNAKWIADNKIEKVVLKRYSEGKWETLNTHKATVNIDRILYEAETPGFSTFAIVGEKDVEVPVIPDLNIGKQDNSILDSPVFTQEEKDDFKENVRNKETNKADWIIPLMIIIIVAAGIFIYIYWKPKDPKDTKLIW